MACSDCPPLVIETVAAPVWDALNRVRTIRQLVASFNAALGNLSTTITDDLVQLISGIPDPPALDLTDLIDYLQCPLTPIAIAVNPALLFGGPLWHEHEPLPAIASPESTITVNLMDGPVVGNGGSLTIQLILPSGGGTIILTDVADTANVSGHLTVVSNTSALVLSSSKVNYLLARWSATFSTPVPAGTTGFANYMTNAAPMDPRIIAIRARRAVQNMASRVLADYLGTIDNLVNSDVVLIVRQFVKEIQRIQRDPATFVVQLAVGLLNANLVRTLCPDIYARTDLPFQQLVDVMSDWTYDGVVPSDLDPRAVPACRAVAAAEAKLALWRQAGAIAV